MNKLNSRDDLTALREVCRKTFDAERKRYSFAAAQAVWQAVH